MAGRVTLREVDRENVRSVCNLEVSASQRHLVGPGSFTIAEAHYEPGSILRAIYLDERPVGVLLVEMDGSIPYLVRFLVDEDHQGGGVGREAVILLCATLRELGHEQLETSFLQAPGGAEGFWLKCGFERIGRRRHGEPVVVRRL